MGKDLKGKELGEGLSQRKNGSYCGRYNDRFGRRISIYDKDLRELKRKLADAIYENRNCMNIIDEKCTLDQWFYKWMRIYKDNVIRPNTKRHYSHIYYAHISPSIGLLPISQITKLQITALINKLIKSGYKWETQNKVRILLVDMFDRALEDNFVMRNPARGVRISNKPKVERRVLTLEEQSIFFECCAGTFYNNLYVVAVNTGLRPGELFALTWDNINLENKTITVTNTLVYQKYLDDKCKTFHLEDPKTKTSKREVPINSLCEAALKKQYVQKQVIRRRNVKQTEFPDLLFTTKFNTPLNSELYSESIDRILSEINLIRDNLEKIDSFSGHTFRHTFATRCIECGIRPKTLQSYLGHATLQMTMDLYVHTTSETKESEMKLLETGLEKLLSNNEEYIEERFVNEKEASSKIVSIGGVKMA